MALRHDPGAPRRRGTAWEPLLGDVGGVRNAVHLASDLRGLQLALDATVRDRYSVAVVERPEGVTVALRRKSTKG